MLSVGNPFIRGPFGLVNGAFDREVSTWLVVAVEGIGLGDLAGGVENVAVEDGVRSLGSIVRAGHKVRSADDA